MSSMIQVTVTPTVRTALNAVTQIRRDEHGKPYAQKANAAYLMELGARALAQDEAWLAQVAAHEEQRQSTLASIGFVPSAVEVPDEVDGRMSPITEPGEEPVG